MQEARAEEGATPPRSAPQVGRVSTISTSTFPGSLADGTSVCTALGVAALAGRRFDAQLLRRLLLVLARDLRCAQAPRVTSKTVRQSATGGMLGKAGWGSLAVAAARVLQLHRVAARVTSPRSAARLAGTVSALRRSVVAASHGGPRKGSAGWLGWRSLSLAAAAAYAVYYVLFAARRPRLTYDNNSPWIKAVLARVPALREKYWPTPWAVNGHVQLAMYILLSTIDTPPQFDRHELELPDGEVISVDWHLAPSPRAVHGRAHPPTVVYLHGISGDSAALAAIVKETSRRGWHSCVINRRGHSGAPLRTACLNVMGDSNDMRYAVKHIVDETRARRPDSPLFLAGISAGSGLLVRYLGEEGADSPFVGAASLCPGWNIAECFKRLRPFYDKFLTQRCKDFFVQRNKHVLEGHPDYQNMLQASSMYEFLCAHARLTRVRSCVKLHVSEYEREVVQPIVERKGDTRQVAMDWYADSIPDSVAREDRDHVAEFLFRSNPMPVADRVKTPLFVLNARDDPVCVEENVPTGDELKSYISETSVLALTEHGSHCAFYEGWWPTSWMDRVTLDWFDAVLAEPLHTESVGVSRLKQHGLQYITASATSAPASPLPSPHRRCWHVSLLRLLLQHRH